ncbi:DUF6350 family protein [Streptomyces rimosus]|uniref:cell division protein PerM n=1 Tax=Streptomyces rimosus TaxID=1927 RepID=UPI00131AC36F|nr:DUF6350 family protein [Streptomyces rimosus]
MSQLTDRGPTLSSRGRASTQRSSALGTAFVGGVLAAGLGLGAFAVAVLLLWVASPYPDTNPSRALHLAADLWFLAHGSDLVRAVTASGAESPVAVTPLLLMALPVWLLYRTGRHILETTPPYGDTAWPPVPSVSPAPPAPSSPTLLHLDDIDPDPGPRLLLGWFLAGYLSVTGAALLYASEGPLYVEPLSALLYVPVVATLTVAVAAWHSIGRAAFVPLPDRVQRLYDRLPSGLCAALEGRRGVTALRAATASVLVLLLCGALLALLALGWHAPAVRDGFLGLTHDWSGRCTVVLLSLVLLPNTVVWGLAYGLGPGFTLGAGSTVGPLGTSGHPGLPHFPLFGMFPEPDVTGPLYWLTAAVPLAAGLALARYAALSAKSYAAATRPVATRPAGAEPACRHEWTGWRETAAAAGLAALGVGVVSAVLAGLAGGALGSAALARFGPSWWQTGLAALSWALLIGVPGALVARLWWLRGVPRPPKPAPRPRVKLRVRFGRAAKRLTRAVGCWSWAACRFAWTALARTASRSLRPRPRPRRHARHARGRTPDSREPYDYAYDRGHGTGCAAEYASGYAPEYAPDPDGGHPWHDASTRSARWSALRASSGGLMTDFEPTTLPHEEAPENAVPGNASAATHKGGG